MEDISFKPAAASDIDLLAELMREFYEFDQMAYDDKIARNALGKVISQELPGRVWLILAGREAIGYVVLVFGCSLLYRGKDAFVDELYIREAYRRRGAGREALKFVEDVCRSEGVEALHLEVAHENHRAQLFYRKLGFKDHNHYLMTKWISR